MSDDTLTTGLRPIIKWPGGKEKELKYIIPNLPVFNRYFEPFVGGGAVFTGIQAEEYFINDLSSELIELYTSIALQRPSFFDAVEKIDCSWVKASRFLDENRDIVAIYMRYRDGEISKEQLKAIVTEFCDRRVDAIGNILSNDFNAYTGTLINELKSNLFRKLSRMRVLELSKNALPEKDIHENIEAAIKSALYMTYRYMYNNVPKNDILHCPLFFFIRNYAYSGMFRYSSKGDFNVPYGGIAYNTKQLSQKLSYYSSPELIAHFRRSNIFNLDFETFLEAVNPDENDFVFLDPPYDTEFSTYAQNDFTKDDQRRLAGYLTNRCRAKWMLIIKNTDFIFNLYNVPGVNIMSFDKEYLVSFMNRNEKKVEHLIITNYQI